LDKGPYVNRLDFGAGLSTLRKVIRNNGTFSVEGIAERVEDSSEYGFADGNGEQFSGRFRFVSFPDINFLFVLFRCLLYQGAF